MSTINDKITVSLCNDDWLILKDYIERLNDVVVRKINNEINITLTCQDYVRFKKYIITYERSLSQFPALYALMQFGRSDVKIGKTTLHPDKLCNYSYNSRGNPEGYFLIGYWQGLLYYNFEQSILNHSNIEPYRIINKNGNKSEWVKLQLNDIKHVVSELTDIYVHDKQYPLTLKISKALDLTDEIYKYEIYSDKSSINDIIKINQNDEIVTVTTDSKIMMFNACKYNSCEHCHSENIKSMEQQFIYCNDCVYCKHIKKLQDDEIKSKAEEFFCQNMSTFKNNHVKKSLLYINKDNIINKAIVTENNIITITNNIAKADIIINGNVTVNNFIITQDKYYEVFISQPDGLKNIEQIKHVFIYLMCGANGKLIFPGENCSNSITFNIDSALYSIKYKDDTPYLHGLIRYKPCDKSTTISANKLKNINRATNPLKKTNIIVNTVDFLNGEKYKYNKDDIKNIVNNVITEKYYGSTLDDFIRT